jgi:hypothetical protein
MIQKYTLALSLAFSSLLSISQTVEIRETAGGSSINGTTVTVSGYQYEDISKYLLAVNTGGMGVDVNMTRYEMSVIAGSKNYYCWGICHSEALAGTNPKWDMPVSVFMSPSVEYGNFFGHHISNNTVGQSTYRFVWFLTSNKNDSTSVDIAFDIALNTPEMLKNMKIMTYPNPATDYVQVIMEDQVSQKAKIEIVMYDVLGNEVSRTRALQDKLRLDVSELDRGVYFYSIMADGMKVTTRKVVLQ